MNSPVEISLEDRINAALPQTQCTRCGYPDCAAYAKAIASGQAAINQCPPGGAQGVQKLSHLTGLPAQPLNPAHGTEGPRSVAIIDETSCIGCTLCLKACPTDAIIGCAKMMHTVIESYCTGCALCVPVCPVDCISLESVTGTMTGWNAWSQPLADIARRRYEAHGIRYACQQDQPTDRLEAVQTSPKGAAAANPELHLPPEPVIDLTERKRTVIEAVLARARAQREKASGQD